MHVPVLLGESVGLLDIKPGGTYADLTLGLGGHAAEILGRLGPGGRLLGFDKDAQALKTAEKNLAGFGERFMAFKSDFSSAPDLIKKAGIETLDGFMMDLGVSTLQLRTPERGFGFSADAPLDMRMDISAGRTAAQLLMELSEGELSRLIFEYGEERWAKVIARRIFERRAERPIKTTHELAELVKQAIPRKLWPPKTHPATRTFQALRIAVNGEMDALTGTLPRMLGMLSPGGRAVVISYHSLEDRSVKNAFRELAKGCTCPPDFPKCTCGKKPGLKILTHRPVTPSEAEITNNPSARSAKLRAAERL